MAAPCRCLDACAHRRTSELCTVYGSTKGASAVQQLSTGSIPVGGRTAIMQCNETAGSQFDYVTWCAEEPLQRKKINSY